MISHLDHLLESVHMHDECMDMASSGADLGISDGRYLKFIIKFAGSKCVTTRLHHIYFTNLDSTEKWSAGIYFI